MTRDSKEESSLQTDCTQAWRDFLTFLQKQCNRVEYLNWIAPIKLLSLDEKGATLATPNIFVGQYLLDNYKDALVAFFPTDTKGDPLVKFVIQEKKSHPKRETKKQPLHTHPSSFTPKLNPTYKFETFIEGPSNQFIKSAAFGVATKPGKAYNPFFIHGDVGLGKTHLLHAIGDYSQKQGKNFRFQCISTEAFINDIVSHLKSKSIEKMKHFYRNLDLLLVDDIQFLQNRLNFEEEFCNTFESLINQGKQIVLTSDKPPAKLQLSNRLINRMDWGLVAHMNLPDLETRVAILQDKAEKKKLHLATSLAFYIAENIHHNVRQLEGAINRLNAYCRLMHVEPSQKIIDTTLGEMFQAPPSSSTCIDEIIQSVASMYHIEEKEIRGKKRLKEIAKARQVAMYLAKELLSSKESLQTIADAFGGKTHATLLHSWKKICRDIQVDEPLKRQVSILRQNVQQAK